MRPSVDAAQRRRRYLARMGIPLYRRRARAPAVPETATEAPPVTASAVIETPAVPAPPTETSPAVPPFGLYLARTENRTLVLCALAAERPRPARRSLTEWVAAIEGAPVQWAWEDTQAAAALWGSAPPSREAVQQFLRNQLTLQSERFAVRRALLLGDLWVQVVPLKGTGPVQVPDVPALPVRCDAVPAWGHALPAMEKRRLWAALVS